MAAHLDEIMAGSSPGHDRNLDNPGQLRGPYLPTALSTARRVITPMRCARYSASA
jgi:cellulose biosynthesis protein BcsQ